MRKRFNFGDLQRPPTPPLLALSPWYCLLLLNSNRMKLHSLDKGVETAELSREKHHSKT